MIRRTLTKDDLARIAPAIFATAPHHGTSDRYRFIPTIEAVSTLMQDWVPVAASQVRVRKPDRMGFQQHLVRFQHPSMVASQVGDVVPEMILGNSHDGKSSFRLSLGLYRLVCSNGLTVSEGTFASVFVRHVGYRAENLLEAAEKVISGAPAMMDQVEDFRTIDLTPDEQEVFAEAAANYRFGEGHTVRTDFLNLPRRPCDAGNDLWHTLNRVQENLVKGRIPTRTPTREGGRRTRRTRPVTSPIADAKLNQALWTLAEGMANLKRGTHD